MIETIKPNKKKAIFLAKKQLSELVTDSVNLEGINYTLPEVQTLLDGVTIGGHKLIDQIITLNQANAWEYIFYSVSNNSFSLEKTNAIALHNIAGKEEALEWGKFRSGSVTIAGTDYLPPSADNLDDLWPKMINESKQFDNIYHQAIYIFLQMSRIQFFYDVNKRMGRFIMNGLLLDHGYPVINLPAKRKEEFNRLMIDFYNTNNHEPMMKFMMSCLDPKLVKIMSE